MLRWTVALLIAANALYFAWTQGYLASAGFAPKVEREPERLQQQVRPEAFRLLNGNPLPPAANAPTPAPAPGSAPEPAASSVAGAEASALDHKAAPAGGAEPAPGTAAIPAPAMTAASPTQCWESSGMSVEQGNALKAVLQGRSDLEGLYALNTAKGGGRWIVYMGKLSEELMKRKKSELKEMNIEFREVRNSPLAPGLALGTFSTEEAGHRGLEILEKKGVRTARVAQERPEKDVVTLSLKSVNTDQKSGFDAILQAFEGVNLSACDQ